MAVKYQLIQIKGEKSTHKGEFYARAKMTDTIDLSGIAERIENNCSLKKSDVVGVLTELIEIMKSELETSHTVKIDGLGFFKTSIRGTYAKSEVAYSAGTNINGFRVVFTPEYTLKKTGTAVNAEGETYVTRIRVASLTKDMKAEQY